MYWGNEINSRKFHINDNDGTVADPSFEGCNTVDGKTLWDWIFISFGPDLTLNWDTARYPNWATQHMHMVEYDPTNGTISAGDIHRNGP
jgi:hypothetical protein